MRKNLLSKAMIFGGMVGFLLFFTVDLFAFLVRQAILSQSVTINLDKATVIWALGKSLVLGFPTGQSCGAAAREWELGNKGGAKSICRSTGKCIVGLFAPIFALLFGLSLLYGPFPFMLIAGSASIALPLQIPFELYFASFPLQIGVVLLVVAHYIPGETQKTVPVTPNLRL